MFYRWGLFAYRHRRVVPLVVIAFIVALFALAGTQQAVVNEDTGEAISNGTLHQCGRHSGVHTAGQGANSAAFLAHLCADIRDELLGNIIGRPVLL